MKVPKGLIAAVMLLAALSGAVYWSNKNKAEKEKAPPPDAAPKILTIPEDQIQEIKITRRGVEPVLLSKASGTWELKQPKAMAADQDAVTGIVTSLANLTSDRLIEEKPSSLDNFGLTSPAEEVTVTKKDGKVTTLLLGDETPTQSGTFVKLANDARVFTIPSYTKTSLDKSPKDLRDKRLLTFNSDKLTRVTVGDIEFGKSGQNEWQILKPKPMRADSSQVDDLVRKLKDAKLDTTVSDEDAKKAQTAFTSGAKVAVAATTDPGGTQTLEIRTAGKDKDKVYYAKSSATEGIWKVPNDLGEALAKPAVDYRNKKLFDFGFTDPDKVEVGAITFTRSGSPTDAKWMSGSTQMDSTGVQTLVDKLRDLTATKFPDTAGGEPFLQLAVTSGSGKRTEKVAVTIKGTNYLAVRDGEPGIYQLEQKAVDDLQKAAASVKPFTPPKSETKKK